MSAASRLARTLEKAMRKTMRAVVALVAACVWSGANAHPGQGGWNGGRGAVRALAPAVIACSALAGCAVVPAYPGGYAAPSAQVVYYGGSYSPPPRHFHAPRPAPHFHPHHRGWRGEAHRGGPRHW